MKCSAEHNEWCGVFTYDGASMELRECRSNGNSRQGFISEKNASMTVADSTATGNKGTGFITSSAGSMVLSDCTASKNANNGLSAEGKGSKIDAVKCSAEQNERSGVFTDDGGCMVLQNVRVDGISHSCSLPKWKAFRKWTRI